MADVAAVLDRFVADIGGPSGRAAAAKIVGGEPPDGTAEWYERNAPAVSAWLAEPKSCDEMAHEAFGNVRKLLERDSVQRLRRMALETYEPFPDCLLVAIGAVLDKFNRGTDPRYAAQLARLCDAYGAQCGAILRAFRAVSSLIPTQVRAVLRKWIEDPELRGDPEEVELLAKVFRTKEATREAVEAELEAYVKEAEQTFWVSHEPDL